MIRSGEHIQAVALVSSGLDSLLAAKIVRDLGVAVRGVHFVMRFDVLDVEERREEVEALVRPLGIRLHVEDISESFLPILLNPEHGYGSEVNPCIDCHLFMLKRAKGVMDRLGARFSVTGEVVGQRPMSQTKPTLFHIDRVSGLKGFILRPLSAKLLPPTLVEEKGWVDREKLYAISGRSRRPQIELARRLGIVGYKQPAGGCILTDPSYAKRFRHLVDSKGRDTLTVEDLQLLRLGRHFWPRKTLQVIVGRDEGDNRALEPFRAGRWVFRPADTDKGPLVLASGVEDGEDVETVAGIVARYSKAERNSRVRVRYENGEEEGSVWGTPVADAVLEGWRVS